MTTPEYPQRDRFSRPGRPRRVRFALTLLGGLIGILVAVFLAGADLQLGAAEPIVLTAASPPADSSSTPLDPADPRPGVSVAPGSSGPSVVPQATDLADPTGVAVALSRELFPDGGAQNIVLTRDAPTGDVFAAAGLVGLFDTTILLTSSEELTPVTASEIGRLGQPNVHILGGVDAVSEQTEGDLAAAGHVVHRHAGPTQAHTAANIAELHFPDARTAVLIATPPQAPSADAASALAASALAASRSVPLLITDPDTLTTVTQDYLAGSRVRQIVVIGGEDRGIASGVIDQLSELGIDSFRWGGANRFETAVAIARNRGFLDLGDAEVAVLVDARHELTWPEGFLQAVVLSRDAGPVLLTDGDNLPQETADYLATAAAGSVDVICMAGVADAACRAATGTDSSTAD